MVLIDDENMVAALFVIRADRYLNEWESAEEVGISIRSCNEVCKTS